MPMPRLPVDSILRRSKLVTLPTGVVLKTIRPGALAAPEVPAASIIMPPADNHVEPVVHTAPFRDNTSSPSITAEGEPIEVLAL